MSTATLGGITLRGSNVYDWELRAGTAPVEREWTITARHANAFQALLGTPQELVIKGPRKTLTVQRVYPLEILPGKNPNLKVLRVADLRWQWPRKWVASSFNVRRLTGDTFLVNDAGHLENALVQPEIKYAKWSLYPVTAPGTPWVSSQVLEFVIDAVGARLSYSKSGATLIDASLEVQDLELDDAGDAAVSRVMEYLPGTDLYVDYDGSVVVYDTMADQGGKTILTSLARKQTNGPDIAMSDRYHVRPSSFIVLFTPEAEIRFNYAEDVSRTADTPSLVNVAPSPDATLTLDGFGRKYARGSLVSLGALFSQWGMLGQLGQALSNDIMRRYGFASGLLENLYGNNPLVAFDSVAAARVRAAMQHWRMTYQVDEVFMQRLAAIRPYRCAILNTETGARAPAAAYCDWVRRPSTKGFAKANDPNVTLGWAVRGYADFLENASVAPARVVVLDPSIGAIRVEPQIDPLGLYSAIMLGYPDGLKLPSVLAGSEANRTGQDTFAQWSAGKLAGDFKLATVLTVVPGSPNDLRRFHKVEISAVQVGLAGNGPPMYIRVFPGVMTARFAWNDDSPGRQLVAAVRGEADYPPDLLVNFKEVEAVARASARRAADVFADRPAGGADVDLDPSLRPAGAIGSIRHALVGGATVTQARVTGVRFPADISRYLPASYRRVIGKILNDQGGPS